jgi:hypothetical protein
MASLDPVAALATPTDVNVELSMNRLARDLDLELLGDVGLVEAAPQLRQTLGNGAS